MYVRECKSGKYTSIRLAKIHIFYITKNKRLLRFHNINIFNTYRGGAHQGGALVSARLCRLPEQEVHQQNYWCTSCRGCSCLNCTNQVNYILYLIGAVLVRLVHYYLVGALETSAPPESTP